MWMWFGYDLGDFLFPGLGVDTKGKFAVTCIVLFIVSVLFEGSKVYIAKLQKEARRKLRPYRTDERRNLLCQHDRDRAGVVEPSTSHNNSTTEVNRWALVRTRILVNTHQSTVFLIHNTVGYLLMLAVMLYNVYLVIVVILGLMLGHYIFGTQLIQLQMKCFGTRPDVICTPECDDTVDNMTPPLLDSSIDSDSEIMSCQTRTCIQPSHYFPANTEGESSSCHFGAKNCPSRVARAKKKSEDKQLLPAENKGCCKAASEVKCCKSSQEISVSVHSDEAKELESNSDSREESPSVTCCRQNRKSDSREQIM